MNFQDSLKSNYRDIEEVNTENRIKRNEELLRKAKETFATIKQQMLRLARNGECTEVEGNKVVTTAVYLPAEFHHMRKEKKTTKYGRTIFGKVIVLEPEERFSHFEIKPEMYSDYELFMSYLKELTVAEGITIKYTYVENERTHQRENIPYVKSGVIHEHFLDWRFLIECEAVIPEKYSNDRPVEVVIPSTTVEEKKVSIDEMEGHEFERYCASVLKAIGYEIELTPGSGDQGVDIIAHKDSIKYGIQCKCYTSDIGNKAVQEAFAGKAYYKCHIGVVLTNRYFTRAAKELAETNGIVLWDRDILLSFINRANK